MRDFSVCRFFVLDGFSSGILGQVFGIFKSVFIFCLVGFDKLRGFYFGWIELSPKLYVFTFERFTRGAFSFGLVLEFAESFVEGVLFLFPLATIIFCIWLSSAFCISSITTDDGIRRFVVFLLNLGLFGFIWPLYRIGNVQLVQLELKQVL